MRDFLLAALPLNIIRIFVAGPPRDHNHHRLLRAEAGQRTPFSQPVYVHGHRSKCLQLIVAGPLLPPHRALNTAPRLPPPPAKRHPASENILRAEISPSTNVQEPIDEIFTL